MSPPRPDLTPAEFNVLKALWRLGHASVAEVRTELAGRGTDVAYTTVMTLLGRLAHKGAVVVDRSREPFVYRAAERRESVLAARLRDFVREVFDGDARAMVLHLAEAEDLSADEQAQLEARITAAEEASAPTPTGRAAARARAGRRSERP